jgi:hypothetical protein
MYKNYIIHVIGLEGCGHHGIENIIYEPLLIKHKNNFKGSTDQDKFNIISKLQSIFNLCSESENYLLFEEKVKDFFKNNEGVYYLSNSYPYCDKRNVNQQWNLIKLNEIVSKYAKIDFIYMKRNIYNTINSHFQNDGGITNHSKNIIDIYKYLENQINLLNNNNKNIIIIEYEKMFDKNTIKILSDFFQLNNKIIENIINKNFIPSKKNYKTLMNKDNIEYIKNLLN